MFCVSAPLDPADVGLRDPGYACHAFWYHPLRTTGFHGMFLPKALIPVLLSRLET